MHAAKISFLVLLAVGPAWVPSHAEPIHHAVAPFESNVQVTAASILSLDASPDLTAGSINGQRGQLPFSSVLVGGTNAIPARDSFAVAEPRSFGSAIPEIAFDELELHFDEFPGAPGAFYVGTSLAGMGIAPGGDLGLPFSVVETPLLLFLANVSIASVSIVLESPFSSPLVDNPAYPGQYQWAGLADVTLSGEIKPGVDVYPDNPEPVPFAFPIPALPLTGSYEIAGGESEIVVGLDADGLDDVLEGQGLRPDPVAQRVEVPIEMLAPVIEEALGPILTALQMDAILEELGDSIFVDISYQTAIGLEGNAFEVHYLPEASGLLGLALGGALLAAVRRRTRA